MKGEHLVHGVQGGSGWTVVGASSSCGSNESPPLWPLGEQETVNVARALQKYLQYCSR